MSQITGPLSINNGAATPVAKSFAPERISPERSVFTERSAASSAGFIRLTAGLDVANASRKTNRIPIELTMPVTTLVDGVNTVAYTGLFKGYFVCPDQMTAAERADLHAFVANGLDKPEVKALVVSLDPMY